MQFLYVTSMPLSTGKSTNEKVFDMTHLITLQQIRDQGPCKDGWAKLLKSLGNPTDYSLQVSFGDIAKSNDALDALWCARCIDDRRFAVSLVMPAVKRAAAFATDSRVHDCIAALEAWLAGDESVDLRAAAYAAADAARAAAYATRDAAYAARAAYAAARAADAAYTAAAAAYTAADAADAAARAAEQQKQVEDIIALSPLHALA